MVGWLRPSVPIDGIWHPPCSTSTRSIVALEARMTRTALTRQAESVAAAVSDSLRSEVRDEVARMQEKECQS